MANYEIELLAKQITMLSGELRKPFPYADCRKVLQEAFNANPKQEKRYHDLIPDLSTYFSDVYSHAAGVAHILEWPSDQIVQSQDFLKRSFFDAYSSYKPLKWRVNQLNTPTLYREIAASDQLRNLLLELLSQLTAERREANLVRQEHLLSAA